MKKKRSFILITCTILTASLIIIVYQCSQPNLGPFIWQPSKQFNLDSDPYLIYPDEILPYIGQYLIAKNEKCTPHTPMIILVPSGLENVQRRNAIRRTWAKEARKINVPVLFLIGSTNDLEMMAKIRREDEITDDLIQWSFHDSFQNLTTKSILMLSWLVEQCLEVKFAIKIDDDLYLDVDMFYQQQVIPIKSHSRSITGKMWPEQPAVIRNALSKYNVPYTIYGQEYWPTYASGTIYLISGDAIKPLFEAAIDLLPALFLEDVYINGFCAQKANVTVNPLFYEYIWSDMFCVEDISNYYISNVSLFGNGCEPRELDFIHQMLGEAIRKNDTTNTPNN